jgi:ATP-binding cassette subfamily B protein
MDYQDENYNAPFSIGVWKNILPFAKPYKNKIIMIVALMIYCSLCDISYPLFLRYAINNFIQNKTMDGLPIFISLIGFAFISQGIVVRSFVRAAASVEINIGKDIRRAVFYHLQTLPFSYYNKTPVGYLMARTMSDTGLIGDRIAWSLVDFIWGGAFVIGAFIAMFALDWRMALIVLAIIPLLGFITAFFQIRILRTNRAARKINSKMTAAMNEGIVGSKTTKTLVIENHNHGEFMAITGDLKKRMTQSAGLRSIYYPLIFSIGSIATAFILYSGGSNILDGVAHALPIGTLSAFISYSLDIFNPIQQIATTITDFVAAQVNVERVTTLLETAPEIIDAPEVMKKYGDNFFPKRENWEELVGEIEFSDVTFSYPESTVNIFEHFDLTVKAGECVAIVGETGAGKSTLVNLVCRFFEPTSGKILIDGKDIKERSQLWLHSHLGYVLQNSHLFSGTVKENIKYGRLDADDEEVIAAAKLISADKIIETLEGKWDADVGEGGDKLSTGQKQLISLARAVLVDPRIFILDEATSSVDTETEQLIQNAITTLLKGRTSFVIAHRLSTIKSADTILLVHDGKIIERGTHDQLMRKKGRYFDLYTRQFEDEIKI